VVDFSLECYISGLPRAHAENMQRREARSRAREVCFEEDESLFEKLEGILPFNRWTYLYAVIEMKETWTLADGSTRTVLVPKHERYYMREVCAGSDHIYVLGNVEDKVRVQARVRELQNSMQQNKWSYTLHLEDFKFEYEFPREQEAYGPDVDPLRLGGGLWLVAAGLGTGGPLCAGDSAGAVEGLLLTGGLDGAGHASDVDLVALGLLVFELLPRLGRSALEVAEVAELVSVSAVRYEDAWSAGVLNMKEGE
jgi:hypothetical protein